MIDLQTETVVNLTEAAGMLPARRAGKKPNVATLYRWTVAGCRGIRLESISVGATRCTSIEALQRFFDRLTAQSSPAAPPAIEPTRLPKHRRQQIEQAQRELAAAGYSR